MSELLESVINKENEVLASMPVRQAARRKLRNGGIAIVIGLIGFALAGMMNSPNVGAAGAIAFGVGVPMMFNGGLEWATKSRYTDWPVALRGVMLLVNVVIVLGALYAALALLFMVGES
jgi:putative flippase GtrA